MEILPFDDVLKMLTEGSFLLGMCKFVPAFADIWYFNDDCDDLWHGDTCKPVTLCA